MTTKPNDPEALEPCPFCHGPAGAFQDRTWHRIKCVNCGAEGAASNRPEKTAKMWNRRAPAQPVADAGGVTQADREAAVKAARETDYTDVCIARMKQGLYDHFPFVQAFARHRLQSVAAATANLQNRIDELTNEAEIFAADHVDQNRMVDRIAGLIGLPHDQELDTVAFELWISAQTAATAAKDAEIARLREVLSAINAEANAATSSDGKERDPWAIGRIAKWSGAALSEAREAGE